MRVFIYCGILIVLLFAGCEAEKMALFQKSAHERYAAGLKSTGLDKTKMGGAWLFEANKSLERAAAVSLPYQEAGYFAEEKIHAVAVKFYSRRGEKLTITWNKKPLNFIVYLDLWKIKYDAGKPYYELIASAPATDDSLLYEAKRSDTLIVRMQPELLSQGEYTMTVTSGPTLGYPFKTPGKRDIQSFYGDARDNGARKHEGIDLFAPKHTPVLAVANGRITSVGENRLGGKVVWMKPKGESFTVYYAHLDSQLVTSLQSVNKGDTIGLLGNTGNAKYTAPHLHLGIYAFGGSIDPLPFVQLQTKKPAEISAPLDHLNIPLRTTPNSTNLLAAPAKNGAVLQKLPAGTIVYASGAVENWLRVTLPDSTWGYVNSRSLVKIEKALKKHTLEIESDLLDQPNNLAARKMKLIPGTSYNVLGTFEGFLFVQSGEQVGWISDQKKL